MSDTRVATRPYIIGPSRTDFVVPTGGFQGPGDIVSGATGWWGFRAYSAAKAATGPYPGIRIDDGNNAFATDINILTTGSIDIAALNTFISAHPGGAFLERFYDQAGTADMGFGAGALQNALAINPAGLSAGRVVWRITASEAMSGVGGGTFSINSPYTISWVAKYTTSGTAGWLLDGEPGIGHTLIIYDDDGSGGSTSNTVVISGTTRTASVTATDNAFHGIQAVYNAATSSINVDGTPSAVLNAGGSTTLTQGMAFASPDGVAWRGDFCEMGVWGSSKIFSNTESSNMSANQKAYWGYT